MTWFQLHKSVSKCTTYLFWHFKNTKSEQLPLDLQRESLQQETPTTQSLRNLMPFVLSDKKKKLYEKTPACGAANRLYAQETAAHPLLSGVLVYGQHESLNKAKFLLMTMVQVGGRAEGMQCQMKCNVRLSLVLLLSQVDGAALLGAAVKEEGEITSHFGSLLLSNHWQGHTNVHTDTH